MTKMSYTNTYFWALLLLVSPQAYAAEAEYFAMSITQARLSHDNESTSFNTQNYLVNCKVNTDSLIEWINEKYDQLESLDILSIEKESIEYQEDEEKEEILTTQRDNEDDTKATFMPKQGKELKQFFNENLVKVQFKKKVTNQNLEYLENELDFKEVEVLQPNGSEEIEQKALEQVFGKQDEIKPEKGDKADSNQQGKDAQHHKNLWTMGGLVAFSVILYSLCRKDKKEKKRNPK